MGEVVILETVTTLDIPVERILDKAKAAGLKRVVVIGETDSDEYFASSVGDGGDVLWMMERAKLKLLRIADQA